MKISIVLKYFGSDKCSCLSETQHFPSLNPDFFSTDKFWQLIDIIISTVTR